MVDKEVSPYITFVMRYFSCNEQMAEKIIKSSMKNGEFDNIKNMVTRTPTERRQKQ